MFHKLIPIACIEHCVIHIYLNRSTIKYAFYFAFSKGRDAVESERRGQVEGAGELPDLGQGDAHLPAQQEPVHQGAPTLKALISGFTPRRKSFDLDKGYTV